MIFYLAVQPIIILFVFVYVIGGVALIPHVSYKQFVVPAVLIQTIAFSSVNTGIALTQDLADGMIDRLRSLPIVRSTVVAGRVLADLARSAGSLALVVGVAYAIGFRFQAGPKAAVGAIALALMFAFAFSWVSAAVGLAVRAPESAQAAGFIWMFPLVFTSTAFAPVERLPGWLQAVARVNPISSCAEALRALCLGGPTQTSVWHAVVWLGAIILIFAPLSAYLYRRTV